MGRGRRKGGEEGEGEGRREWMCTDGTGSEGSGRGNEGMGAMWDKYNTIWLAKYDSSSKTDGMA